MKDKNHFPKKLQTELGYFFEYTPPARLNRNLRRLLTSYLAIQKDGHIMNVEDLIIDIQALFELLDTAEDELKTRI